MWALIWMVLIVHCNTFQAVDLTNKSSVDPCNNFGKYVCEDLFKSEKLIEDHLNNLPSLEDVETDIFEKKLNLFSDTTEKEENEIFSLMKKFFQACMDLDRLKERAYAPILEIFNDTGGIPFVHSENWNETNWSINRMLHHYPLLYEILFKFKVTQNEIIVDLNFEYFRTNEKLMQILNTVKSDNEDMSNIIDDFWTISNSILYKENNMEGNTTFNETELVDSASILNFISNAKSLCDRDQPCLQNLLPEKLKNNKPEIKYNQEDFPRLENVLKSTPKKTLANFFGLLIINHMESHLFISNMYHFSRKEKCYDETNHYFYLAANSLYMKKLSTIEHQKFVSKYVNQIKEDYLSLLNNELKQEAKAASSLILENLETILDFHETKLQEMYKNLSVNETDYFEMILQLELFMFKNQFIEYEKDENSLENLLNIHKKSSLELEGKYIYIPPILATEKYISLNFSEAVNFARIGIKVVRAILDKFSSVSTNLSWLNEDVNINSLTRNHTFLLFTQKNRTSVEKKMFWVVAAQENCRFGESKDLNLLFHNIHSSTDNDIYGSRFNEKQFPGYKNSFNCTANSETVICATKPCTKTSERIQALLNKKADRCDNFWEFTCGGLRNNHTKYFKFQNLVQDDIKGQRYKTLIAPIESTDPAPHKLAKSYFAKCLEENKNESQSLQNLLDKLGGFPLIDGNKWIESDWSLNKVLQDFPMIYFWIYDFQVNDDVVKISVQNMRISKDYNFTSRILKKLFPDAENIDEASRKFNQFMRCIFNKDCNYLESINEELSQNETIFLIDSVEKINETCSEEANGCLNSLLPQNLNWKNISIIFNEEDFQRLRHLISKTSKRDLANNFMILISTYEVNYLLSSYNEKRFSMLRTSKSLQKWETCLEHVMTFLEYATFSFHYETFVPKNLRNQVEMFSRQILKDYIKLVNSSEYISFERKAEFIDKVSDYEIVVGYVDEVLNTTNIENYYEDWIVSDEDFFEMSIDLQLKNELQLFKKLQKDFLYLPDLASNIVKDKLYTHENSAIIDGTLYINALVFSDLFFSNVNIKAVNYATLGKVIIDQVMGDNHEIFTNETLVNENYGIMDQLIKLYEINTEFDKDIEKLPGLDTLSNEQLLYLITAQSYCETDKDGKLNLKHHNKIFPQFKDIFHCNNN